MKRVSSRLSRVSRRLLVPFPFGSHLEEAVYILPKNSIVRVIDEYIDGVGCDETNGGDLPEAHVNLHRWYVLEKVGHVTANAHGTLD